MKTIQNNKIDRYLMGRMNGRERKRFQTQIQLDDQLAQEVEIQRLLVAQIKELGDVEMRKKLEKIKIDLTKEESLPLKNTQIDPKIIRWSSLVVAASILFLVFGYLRYQTNSSTSSQELYSQNYAAYQLPFNTRSADFKQALWTTAGSFYQQREYAKAIPLLESVLEKIKPLNAKAQLALGICQMEIAQFEKAIPIFEEIINNNGHYTEHAIWYTAMAYLGLNDLVASKKLLNKIVENRDNYFYQQAQELLAEID